MPHGPRHRHSLSDDDSPIQDRTRPRRRFLLASLVARASKGFADDRHGCPTPRGGSTTGRKAISHCARRNFRHRSTRMYAPGCREHAELHHGLTLARREWRITRTTTARSRAFDVSRAASRTRRRLALIWRAHTRRCRSLPRALVDESGRSRDPIEEAGVKSRGAEASSLGASQTMAHRSRLEILRASSFIRRVRLH